MDYSLVQIYTPYSKWIFSINLILVDQENIDDTVYQEFEKSMLNYVPKFKIFLVESPESKALMNPEPDLPYKLIRTMRKNQFTLKIQLPSSINPELNQEFKLRIRTVKSNLDPNGKDKMKNHLLKEKTSIKEVKVLKEPSTDPLNQRMTYIANITSKTNEVTSTAATWIGLVMMMTSNDPDGILLRFSQYIKFLNRVKLIGGWFGRSLQTFIETLSTSESSERFREEENDSGDNFNNFNHNQNEASRRNLENSIEDRHRSRVISHSNGYKNKMNRFRTKIFLEGTFLIKILLYDISWCSKLIGDILLARMRKRRMIVNWYLQFLKYQRKAHLPLVMSTLMDLFFYGVRILAHRRNDHEGVVAKVVCAFNLCLIAVDLIEIVITSLRIGSESDWGETDSKLVRNQSKEMRSKSRATVSNVGESLLIRKNINPENLGKVKKFKNWKEFRFGKLWYRDNRKRKRNKRNRENQLDLQSIDKKESSLDCLNFSSINPSHLPQCRNGNIIY